MDDTPAKIKKRFRKMLLEKPGQERLLMGANMAESAKIIALSSMAKEENDINKKIKLFLRFYSNDFTKSEQAKIINHLQKFK